MVGDLHLQGWEVANVIIYSQQLVKWKTNIFNPGLCCCQKGLSQLNLQAMIVTCADVWLYQLWAKLDLCIIAF